MMEHRENTAVGNAGVDLGIDIRTGRVRDDNTLKKRAGKTKTRAKNIAILTKFA